MASATLHDLGIITEDTKKFVCNIKVDETSEKGAYFLWQKKRQL